MTSLAPLQGRYWRMLGVRWQRRPLESGSHRTGGRWNPMGMPALYLSADYVTAIVEMHQELVRPGTLAAYAPAGSIRKGAPVERRDYEAWQPE